MKNSILSKIISAGIAAMLLSSSLTASDYLRSCQNIDRTVERVMANASNKVYKNENVGVHQKVRTSVCPQIMKRYGVNMSFNLKSLSGMSKSYGVDEFCVNVDSYISHTYDRYLEEKDITILYKFYANFFRMNIDSVNVAKKRNSFGPLQKETEDTQFYRNVYLAGNIIDQVAMYDYYNHIPMESFRLAKHIFSEGYQGTETQVSFNDPEFHEFMTYVMSRDFYSADLILDTFDGKGIREETIKNCNSIFE